MKLMRIFILLIEVISSRVFGLTGGYVISPSHDRRIVVSKREDVRFSWEITYVNVLRSSLTSLSVYNPAKGDENKVWTATDGIQRKGNEMFSGRLKVDFTEKNSPLGPISNGLPGPVSNRPAGPISNGPPGPMSGRRTHMQDVLTVTIKNVNFNDAVTMTLSFITSSGNLHKSSVTLDVRADDRDDNRKIVVKRGEDISFSWPIYLAPERLITSLFIIYRDTTKREHKLWSPIKGVQRDGQEMFGGRLKIGYVHRKELYVNIRNVDFNDTRTFVMQLSTSFGNAWIGYESLVTLDVQANTQPTSSPTSSLAKATPQPSSSSTSLLPKDLIIILGCVIGGLVFGIIIQF